MLLESALSNLIKIGTLNVTFPDGSQKRFGTGNHPKAALKIKTNRARRGLLLNPALAIGEAYMDGELEPVEGGLFDVLDFLAMNSMDGGRHFFDKLMEKVRWFRRHLDQFNSAGRSRRNVAHHYDLDA